MVRPNKEIVESFKKQMQKEGRRIQIEWIFDLPKAQPEMEAK